MPYKPLKRKKNEHIFLFMVITLTLHICDHIFNFRLDHVFLQLINVEIKPIHQHILYNTYFMFLFKIRTIVALQEFLVPHDGQNRKILSV